MRDPSHNKRHFDPRPGRASATGPNSIGQVPLTRIAPLQAPTPTPDRAAEAQEKAEATAAKQARP